MWKYAFWLVLLGLPFPFMVIEWLRMWQSDFYGYLPVLGVVFVSLFFIRWDRSLRLPVNRMSQILIALGLIALLTATSRFSPWLGSMSWVLLVGAFLAAQSGKIVDGAATKSPLSFLYIGGRSSVAHLWPLTWIALPLPWNLDHWLVAKVNLTALKMSSYLLDFMRVPHRMFADIVELRADQISIEQIYDGIQSTYALSFVAILIVVFLGRSVWLVPIYLAAAVFWSVLMNVLRIVPTVCVRAWYEWDWTTGWQHATLNLIALAVVVLCLLSSDRLFKVIFFPTKPDRLASKPNPIVSFWNQMFWPYTPQTGSPNSSPLLKQL